MSKPAPRRFAEVQWLIALLAIGASFALMLKTERVLQDEESFGLLDLPFVYSGEILAISGFSAVAFGLWAVFRGSRRLLYALVAVTVAYIFFVGASHSYYDAVGTALSWDTIWMSLASITEIAPVAHATVAPMLIVSLVLFAVGAIVVPARLHRRAVLEGRGVRVFVGVPMVGVGALLLTWGALSPPDGGHRRDLVRDPTLAIVAQSSLEWIEANVYFGPVEPRPPGMTRIERAPNQAPARNLVVVLLESTGEWATRPDVTPGLVELRERAWYSGSAYSVIPHTSKALVATLCGIEPNPSVMVTEALDGGLPARCLARLLGDQGYRTAYFQSATQEFERRAALAEHMGYEHFGSGDQWSHEGFEDANYFGVEDRVMLEPSRRWLEEHVGPQPLFVTYLTNTAHHDYRAPSHYGRPTFDDDDLKNRYLRSVYYQDRFLTELLEQYEDAGIADETVFVILGDHGEGFGEHGRFAHDDVIWEQGSRVPLIVVAPDDVAAPRDWGVPASQLDVLPTVLDLLGYDYAAEQMVGRSLARVEPAGRSLYLRCFHSRTCLARVDGSTKYIHHYGLMPDELFDLSADPDEQRNLLESEDGRAGPLRDDVMAWWRSVRSLHEGDAPASRHAGL